ncbi:MAG: fatty acid cistrans isomerase [Myxococcaceae bacterium]|nr:fatty acid cistrans isomerase [Myxococcaceae bacterium]
MVCLMVACSSTATPDSEPVTMPVASSPPDQQALQWQSAKQTFDQRCVVCHGCYDSPCQLKLSSWDGIARGGTKQKIYDATRLREAKPTRLNVDAQGIDAWRAKGFYPVLPENEQTDPRLALLTRMLDLKRDNPLVLDRMPLPKEFELGLDRDEQCATPDEFEGFKKAHPSWGMPYALPALADSEYLTLAGWVASGTPHEPEPALVPAVQDSIARWETFFNAPGLKQQLVSRYIYEHLFLGWLYFEGLDEQTFFRLVRSRTPSGLPIDEIATRRPFEDPGEPVVYYRFVRRDDTRLSKTQMPYALSDKRLARYHELFLESDYDVAKDPGYSQKTASNPFKAFSQLPVRARYRFMLEEALFTMAGFIKGPVCRGQVALDVIEDRFWITFIDPESPITEHEAELLEAEADDLGLPAEQGSNNPLVTWRKYAKQEQRFLEAKSKYLTKLAASPSDVSLDQIWDGDGTNSNAALTVMRHFDSATVVKGLVGGAPKTAWVIGYSLLERIHYLLVAGYDVFGNIGHQLHSRLYMDFLRMEAEYNFLTFLPMARRKPLMESWYRDTNDEVKDHVYGKYAYLDQESGLPYTSDTPEQELYRMLTLKVAPTLERRYEVETESDLALRDALLPLAHAPGQAATLLPETSFLEVQLNQGGQKYFTILRDSAHTNVAHLFSESDRRVPEEDSLTLLRGFVGAYPNALYSVLEDDVPAFVDAVSSLSTDDSYDALRMRFGVRRTDARFWDYSDRAHAAFRKLEPIGAGLFDYNRLDGR